MTDRPILVKTVGTAVRSIHGGGTLHVWPADPAHIRAGHEDLPGEPPIEHTRQSVQILCARLMFPSMNMTVLLHDGERTAAVRGSCFSRRGARTPTKSRGRRSLLSMSEFVHEAQEACRQTGSETGDS